ncbi:MAG TPA: hypothetical protein PLH60_04220 [Proteiniphilum sp.]|nr:hypothetical protein [Proteiniphilum sp.]HPJ51161.1 hypothetical protein [Proteiniphilum sp.]HPR19744.1 hypothetical protein [Proteiniphilum sp.]
MEKEFESLLEKFYRGETDCREEQLLAGYLNSESLPARFEADRELFQLLSSAAPEMPKGLESQMGHLIDRMEMAELSGKRTEKGTLIRRNFKLRIAGLVASLMFLATIGFWTYFSESDNKSLLTDTFENPEQAEAATLEALQLFANNFSKGTRTVEHADRQVDKAFGILRETVGQGLTIIEDPVNE